MTEDEKEAIEYIEDEVYSIEDLEIQEIIFYSKGVEDIKTILNLVQNQRDKIEQLEEKIDAIETYYDISDLEQMIRNDV